MIFEEFWWNHLKDPEVTACKSSQASGATPCPDICESDWSRWKGVEHEPVFFFKRTVSESPETVRTEKWRNGNVFFLGLWKALCHYVEFFSEKTHLENLYSECKLKRTISKGKDRLKDHYVSFLGSSSV